MLEKWTHVAEGLPEPFEDYWAFTDSVKVLAFAGGVIHLAYFQRWEDEDMGDKWVQDGRDGYELDGVTYWRPLPEGPKQC